MLCAFAALLQVFASQLHAQTMQRGGPSLAALLCGPGQSGATLLAELRELVPAELLASLDGDEHAPGAPDCPLCASSCASPAAPSPSLATLHSLQLAAPVSTLASPLPSPTAHRALPPPLRGPPHPSA